MIGVLYFYLCIPAKSVLPELKLSGYHSSIKSNKPGLQLSQRLHLNVDCNAVIKDIDSICVVPPNVRRWIETFCNSGYVSVSQSMI